MPTYDEWNKAIISYFFENCEPGEIVFLHTTPETLPEIAEHASFDVVDAEKSLIDTVRKKVVLKNKVIPTDEIWLRRISPSEKEPPHVAFLALCVLAANNMGTSEEAFHTNYYVPLNLLLFDKPNEGKPKGLKYRDWEENWIYLKDWVKDKHDVELYLTQGHPKYVWYPISQCLISKHDENKLHVIFKEAELKPGAYLAEKQLLDILCSKRSFQNLSVKITRPIDQEKTAETRLILGQIQLLLKNWHGEVGDEPVRHKFHTISVHLFDIPDEIDEVCFWFRRRRRQNSQITFKNNALNVKTLQPHNDQWFEPHVIRANPLSIQMLQNGIKLKTTDAKPLTYRIEPADIWVFRWDTEHADGWISTNSLLLHEEHLIVYSRQLGWKVIPFLQQVCDEIPASKPIRIGGKGAGWEYIKATPTRLYDSSLFGFRITTTETEQIKFVGGLPLDRRSNSYIDFCLPTIVVPNLIADSDQPIYMNDQPVDIPSNRKIELPDRLNSDKYHLSYLDCLQITLHIITPKRLTEYQYKSLTTVLSTNRETIPTYSKETIADITEEPGVWLAGAKLFGTDIPETTWEDVVEVPIEPLSPKYDKVGPAQLISSVVKLAIELKNNGASIPECFDETIHYLEENVAVKTLVQKKLKQYKEKALSFDDLRRYIRG